MPGKPRTGKPVGRPRGSVTKAKLQLRDMAQEYGEVALKTLVEVCRRGDTDSSRVQAANALLDRGFGKPLQGIQVSGLENQAPVKVDWSRVPTDVMKQLLDARITEDENEEG